MGRPHHHLKNGIRIVSTVWIAGEGDTVAFGGNERPGACIDTTQDDLQQGYVFQIELRLLGFFRLGAH